MALSKNTIKFLRSLHQKKFRRKFNKFIVEGDKIITELLAQNYVAIESIYALPSWIAANRSFKPSSDDLFTPISAQELKHISAFTTPNQVLALCNILDHPLPKNFDADDFSFYLDNVQDPGNFGTIIRTADWFGIRSVFCSPNSVELYNRKVLQATMGAFSRVRCHYVGLGELKKIYPEATLYGTFLQGESVFQLRPQKPALIVIGNESNGISAENILFLDQKVTIPGTTDRKMESLNAAVAAGIVMAVFKSYQHPKV